MNNNMPYNPARTKMLAVAPLMFIPFLTLGFYVLGGGSGKAKAKPPTAQSGLNTLLPSPNVNEKEPDKFALYQLEDRDSAKKHNQDRSMNLFDRRDPFAASLDGDSKADDMGGETEPSRSSSRLTEVLGLHRRGRTQHPADALEEKLAMVQRALAEPPTPAPARQEPVTTQRSDETVMRQLEAAMSAIQQSAGSPQVDTELTIMNGMLEKVLDIKYPDRVRDRMEKSTPPQKGMRVAPYAERPLVDELLVQTRPGSAPLAVSGLAPQAEGFFELESSNGPGANGVQPSIAAVVHGDQRLVTGGTIKVRIDQDIFVQSQPVPKGAFIYGKCTLSGERVQIAFNCIRHGQYLFPVKVTAYGLDGLPGIPIPGSITRDAAKQGTNEAIQAISMGSLDPSIGAQATAAGIDAAKTLLTKKVRLVRFTIKADYPLLLQDDTAQR